MTHMNRALVAVLPLGLFLLSGCSKALTESSASGVIQKWIDSLPNGPASTPAGALTGQIGVEMPNPWSLAGVQRLINAGYLDQKTMAVSYPNFSGQYSDVREEPAGFVTVRFVDTYDIQTITATRPPHVEGSFRSCFVNNCDAGSVNGFVNRRGPSFLTLSFRARENPLSQRMVTYTRSLVVSLERGQTDAIVGNYNMGVENPFVPAKSIPIRANRVGPNPSDVQQEVYVYTWTNKLPNDTFNGPTLKLGRLVVDTCDHLLLTSETAATASCKTHVKLTGAAEIIFGSRPTDRVMQAYFGKQPDGRWIGTGTNYSPPQYDISQ